MNAHQSARRRLLTQAAALPVLLVLSTPGKSAAPAGRASKEDFHYQDQPNEGKRCANCVQFMPPAAGQPSGTCRIVAGAISANGWCMAYSPR